MYMHATHFYDLFDFDTQETNAQQAFFLSHAEGCKHVLDVGAGSGTIAFSLARQGISVACLEPSPTMRSLLISRLAYAIELQKYITPLPYDAIDFRLSRLFPLVYSSNVMHLILDEGERTKVMSNVVHHLEPRGKVIVDFRVGGLTMKEREFSGELNLGEIQYRRYTSVQQLEENKWSYTWFFEIYDRDKQIEAFQEGFQIRIDRPKACREVFAKHRLSTIAEYSDYSFTAFEPTERPNRLIIVGRHDVK